MLFWILDLVVLIGKRWLWEQICRCNSLCIFRVYISERFESSYICLLYISLSFCGIHFCILLKIPPIEYMKTVEVPTVVLKLEVRSLHLKAFSKALVTNVSVSYTGAARGIRHYSQPLLILLAATRWIGWCFYCIVIQMYCRAYLHVSSENIFFLQC